MDRAIEKLEAPVWDTRIAGSLESQQDSVFMWNKSILEMKT